MSGRTPNPNKCGVKIFRYYCSKPQPYFFDLQGSLLIITDRANPVLFYFSLWHSLVARSCNTKRKNIGNSAAKYLGSSKALFKGPCFLSLVSLMSIVGAFGAEWRAGGNITLGGDDSIRNNTAFVFVGLLISY